MKPSLFLLGATVAATLMLSTSASAAERLFAVPTAGGDNILELNPLTGAQINTFPSPEPVSGFGPDGLAFDGKTLWFVTDSESDKLWQLDPDTGEVQASTQLPSGNYDGLAALGGKIYIEEWVKEDILEFDPATNTITNVLDFDVLNPTVDIRGGLAGAGDALVAMDFFSNVLFINPATGEILGSFPTGGDQNTGVAVLGNEVYLADTFSPLVQVFALDGTLVRSFNAPGGIGALGGDQVDADGDGVPDFEDHCVPSDLRDWVDTGSGPTSVPNVVDEHGCSIQDFVNEIAAGARNHGQYVSGIAKLVASLQDAGLVSNKQAAELKRGAARS